MITEYKMKNDQTMYIEMQIFFFLLYLREIEGFNNRNGNSITILFNVKC